MNVTTVEVEHEVADKKYKEYLEAVKTRKAREYNELRRAYRAMAKGYKLIDIYKAFADTGIDEKGQPKLAIARADTKQVYFSKQQNGAGFFTRHRNNWQSRETASEVHLPEGTFEGWEKIKDANGNRLWNAWADRVVTNVPIIPANVVLPGKPENYYILFEVDHWNPVAAVRDPYLLQRINDNTFIVLAEWDVTDVEAIVMRSRAS